MNDCVTDMQGTILYAAPHADVKAWLETPGNTDDTTRVQYGPDSGLLGQVVYATEYLNNYSQVYPNG